MATDLNVCTFSGRVGQDPETKADGKLKTFGLAVNNYGGANNPEVTMWIQVNLWQERGKVAQYIKKGMKLTVTGELNVREYEGKQFYSLNAFRVVLPDRSEGGAVDPGTGGRQRGAGRSPSTPSEPDDDLPF